ncbi:MAG: hypothetical protein U0796_14740 [Gemmatales bacterium]
MAAAKPTNDSYTVLLTISLVAMIVSCVLLYYDIKRYPSVSPPAGSGMPTKIGG